MKIIERNWPYLVFACMVIAGLFAISLAPVQVPDAQAGVNYPFTNSSGIHIRRIINVSFEEVGPAGKIATFQLDAAPSGWYELDGTTWHSRIGDAPLFTAASSFLVNNYPTFITATSFKLWPVDVGYDGYAKLWDAQTSGTSDGTFTSGAEQTRTLNNEYDPAGFCNLSSNDQQFILDAGTYYVHAIAPGVQVDHHRAQLYDVTGTTTLVLGTVEHSLSSAAYCSTSSTIKGEFTIAANHVLELRHRCETTRATYGFGSAGSFGTDEIYSVVEIWRKKRGVTCIKR